MATGAKSLGPVKSRRTATLSGTKPYESIKVKASANARGWGKNRKKKSTRKSAKRTSTHFRWHRSRSWRKCRPRNADRHCEDLNAMSNHFQSTEAIKYL